MLKVQLVALIILVYCIEAILIFITSRFVKFKIHNNCQISIKRTIYVFTLILGIYFIPIISFTISFVYWQPISFLLLLGIMLSVFPVTKYIIIPLSELNYIKSAGKNSIETKMKN